MEIITAAQTPGCSVILIDTPMWERVSLGRRDNAVKRKISINLICRNVEGTQYAIRVVVGAPPKALRLRIEFVSISGRVQIGKLNKKVLYLFANIFLIISP